MRSRFLLPLAVAALLGGCGESKPDEGTLPPPTPAPTATQLDSMPPEARRAAEAAAKQGGAQAAAAQQQAEAIRKARGGG